METISKKEKIAFAVSCIAVVLMILILSYDIFAKAYDFYDILYLVGISIMFSQLIFTPKIFFLPIKEALSPNLPTIIISRKSVSFLSIFGTILFFTGIIGQWFF